MLAWLERMAEACLSLLIADKDDKHIAGCCSYGRAMEQQAPAATFPERVPPKCHGPASTILPLQDSCSSQPTLSTL